MELSLTNSPFKILIDDEDFAKISYTKWRLHKSGYPVSTRRPHPKLHIVLLGKAPDGFEWDHKDGNRLNNQRGNLRHATDLQNRWNSRATSETGLKGVYSDGNRWRAAIKVKGKEVHLGSFGSQEEAATVYNEAALKYHGEFARLNPCPQP